VVLVVLLLGGCSVAVVAGAGWFASTVRGPADAANAYLDDARAGEQTPATACASAMPVEPAIASSTGQNLNEVEISGGLADVGGSLTLEDGTRVEVTVALERRSDSWCVVVATVRDR
jgi:hypothetical protein